MEKQKEVSQMKEKPASSRPPDVRRPYKRHLTFCCYLCFSILLILLSGCATIKPGNAPSLPQKTTDFNDYSVSYMINYSRSLDPDHYFKINPEIEKALRDQNRFHSVQNKRYGDSDIHISYDLYTVDLLNFTDRASQVCFWLTLGLFPAVKSRATIISYIEITHNGVSQDFKLRDDYKYWISLPSLLWGWASGSTHTFPKWSQLLVQRTIELLEGSNIFEPYIDWELE